MYIRWQNLYKKAAMQQTSKAYFLRLTILHGVLLAAQLIFGAMAYYINSTGPIAGADAENLDASFQFVVPIFILVSYFGSTVLLRMQLKPLKEKSNLKDKLTGYLSVLLVRYALLEVPALFSIICFIVTGNYFYLGWAALVILEFLRNRPTVYRTVNELQLTPAEKALLEDPDAIVI